MALLDISNTSGSIHSETETDNGDGNGGGFDLDNYDKPDEGSRLSGGHYFSNDNSQSSKSSSSDSAKPSRTGNHSRNDPP